VISGQATWIEGNILPIKVAVNSMKSGQIVSMLWYLKCGKISFLQRLIIFHNLINMIFLLYFQHIFRDLVIPPFSHQLRLLIDLSHYFLWDQACNILVQSCKEPLCQATFPLWFIPCCNCAVISFTLELWHEVIFYLKNGPFTASFSLFSSFQYTVDSKQMFNI